MHACMGDGELSGTGIEIAGRMCLKVTVYHDRPVARPVIETFDGIYFLASRPTLDESIKVATADVVEFLMKKLSLNFPDAYRLMSATCDAQICEVVDDNVTVRLHCPKFDTRIQTL
jgi:amidase